MNRKVVKYIVVKDIEDLIDRWAETMGDEEFIDALDEMVDRATTARDARREELGGNE